MVGARDGLTVQVVIMLHRDHRSTGRHGLASLDAFVPDLSVLNSHPGRVQYKEVEHLKLGALGLHDFLHFNGRRHVFRRSQPTRWSNRAAPASGPPRQRRPSGGSLDGVLRRSQRTAASVVQCPHRVDEQVPAVQRVSDPIGLSSV